MSRRENILLQILNRVMFFALVFFATTVYSQETLDVGIKVSPPFAEKSGSDWQGSSVDIISEVARDLGRPINFVEYDTVGEMLVATQNEEVDLSISAITVTSLRESFVDFSMPYMATNIGVLVRDDSSIWAAMLEISFSLVKIIGALVIFLYTIGYIAWKVDKDQEIHSANEGAYWVLVTISTVGYGDIVPKGKLAMFMTSALIVIGLLIFGTFTGYMSSSFTVTRLNASPTTLSDLENVTVVAIENTTGQDFLEEQDIPHFTASTFEDALDSFYQGRSDAVVYDNVLLDHAITGSEQYRVWPLSQSSDFYAIALPEESVLQEAVDRSILSQIRN